MAYFCFALIGLINDYKNICYRNNNVCLVVFMCINTFKKLLLVWKGVIGGIFGFVGMIFNVILNLVIFNIKKGYSGVMGYG